MWTWQSINPGMTVRPRAPSTSASGRSPQSASGPIAAIRSRSISRLVPGRGAAPVPSMTVAPRMSRARGGGSVAPAIVTVLEAGVEERDGPRPGVGAGIGRALWGPAVGKEGLGDRMTAGEDGRRHPGLPDDVTGAVVGEVLVGEGVIVLG